MTTIRQQVCVLHVRAWRETSLLLECLTADHGRVGLLARGARGPRARVARAVLEPFQSLVVEYRGRGELATLTAVEPVGPPRFLAGTQLLSGLYLNELLVRLLPRFDHQPGLLARYEATLDALQSAADLAWTLRRFERDLLAVMGYGIELDIDADSGAPLDPVQEYTLVAEHGLRLWRGQPGLHVTGAALLDFAADRQPGSAAMPGLRRLLRAQIGALVGERGLESWRVLDAALKAGRHAASAG
ncbi:MAG TPA: DNA repair protein RecO [Rhodanobacteraceae bacterium]|nr:DNA repair protein RecO [Rhodanobacteraceae bacterium]